MLWLKLHFSVYSNLDLRMHTPHCEGNKHPWLKHVDTQRSLHWTRFTFFAIATVTLRRSHKLLPCLIFLFNAFVLLINHSTDAFPLGPGLHPCNNRTSIAVAEVDREGDNHVDADQHLLYQDQQARRSTKIGACGVNNGGDSQRHYPNKDPHQLQARGPAEEGTYKVNSGGGKQRHRTRRRAAEEACEGGYIKEDPHSNHKRSRRRIVGRAQGACDRHRPTSAKTTSGDYTSQLTDLACGDRHRACDPHEHLHPICSNRHRTPGKSTHPRRGE